MNKLLLSILFTATISTSVIAGNTERVIKHKGKHYCLIGTDAYLCDSKNNDVDCTNGPSCTVNGFEGKIEFRPEPLKEKLQTFKPLIK